MPIINKKPDTNWKIGDTAYIIAPYIGIIACRITDITDKLYHVSSPFYNADLPACRMFRTVEEIENAQKESNDRQTERYKKEIDSVEDLLRFALKVPVAYCEEYTNENAIRAFKEKALELLNIRL